LASVQVSTELLALLGAIQLVERLGLDLPDAFLDRFRISPISLSVFGSAPSAEAQPHDALLLGVQFLQGFAKQDPQGVAKYHEVGRRYDVLLEFVGEMEIVLLVDDADSDRLSSATCRSVVTSSTETSMRSAIS